VVKTIAVYAEGAGPRARKDFQSRFREAFATFLESPRKRAEARGIEFRVVPSGGWTEALGDFARACGDSTDELSVLLIDSDCPVGPPADGDETWVPEDVRTLACRDPREFSLDQVHFMVQVMESWFLADRDTVIAYFRDRPGQFDPSRLPDADNVEAIPKDDVLIALLEATNQSYSKTMHAPDLLRHISPSVVRGKASFCDRLLAYLDRVALELG
jgi:hypothetical protein